jgi:hypothetical protein
MVDVMDNFIWRKESAKMLFYYQAMFHHVSLAICMRVMGCQASPVRAVSSVGNPPLVGGMVFASDIGALPSPFALNRAELSIATAHVADVFAALSALVWRGCPPAGRSVALSRAIFRRSFPPVFWMKRPLALGAFQRQCCSFHAHIIAREERYCEIAARRLEQQVPLIGGEA